MIAEYSYLRDEFDKSVLSYTVLARFSKYLISGAIKSAMSYSLYIYSFCLHAPTRFFIQRNSRLHELQPLYFRPFN